MLIVMMKLHLINTNQELFHTFNDTKSDDDFNNCIKFINKYGINSFIAIWRYKQA